jgi:hypothetical protein
MDTSTLSLIFKQSKTVPGSAGQNGLYEVKQIVMWWSTMAEPDGALGHFTSLCQGRKHG